MLHVARAKVTNVCETEIKDRKICHRVLSLLTQWHDIITSKCVTVRGDLLAARSHWPTSRPPTRLFDVKTDGGHVPASLYHTGDILSIHRLRAVCVHHFSDFFCSDNNASYSWLDPLKMPARRLILIATDQLITNVYNRFRFFESLMNAWSKLCRGWLKLRLSEKDRLITWVSWKS